MVHVPFAEPYCPALRKKLIQVLLNLRLRHSKQGTYVALEGPRYETAAEVKVYAFLGGDVVGMTNMPEAVLAREAEICYVNCSVVTNMGSGLSIRELSHEEVTEAIQKRSGQITAIMQAFIDDNTPPECQCHCQEALKEYGGFHLNDFADV